MQPLHVFSVLLVLLAIIEGSECCSCETLHPQTYYCSSNFAIKGQVKTSEVITQDGGPPSSLDAFYKTHRFLHEATLVYDVYIKEVYKGGNLVSPNTRVNIFSRGYASCSPAFLQVNQTYIITGFSRILNELEIGSCGYYEPINTLTRKLVKGFEVNYEKTCDQCSVCGSEGCGFSFSNIGRCRLELSSNGVSRCEIDFARCGMNKRNQCVWLGGRAYRKCKLNE